jgi:hypothetical protein
MTEPATNATAHGPQTPPPQFTDDKPSSGPQHARHFHNRSLGISNEAKYGHRKDKVESCVIERQPFCLPLNEPYLSGLAFGTPLRRGDHCWICVESRYDCSTAGEFRCKRTVAAADIQQYLVGDRAEKLEEQPLLQRIGNLAKPARSPPGVGLGQSLCRLHTAHEAFRMAVLAGCDRTAVIPQRQVC